MQIISKYGSFFEKSRLVWIVVIGLRVRKFMKFQSTIDFLNAILAFVSLNADISKMVKFIAKMIKTKVFGCFMENIKPGKSF